MYISNATTENIKNYSPMSPNTFKITRNFNLYIIKIFDFFTLSKLPEITTYI